MGIRESLALLTSRYGELKTKKLATASLIDQITVQLRRIYESDVAPEIYISATSPQDPSGPNPLRVGFTSTVARTNSPIVSYAWSSPGGTVASQGQAATFINWDSSGQKRVTLTVVTQNGKTYSFFYDIALGADQSDPVESFHITVDQPQPGTYNVYARAHTVLNRGSVVSYDWYVDNTLIAPNAGPNPLLQTGGPGQRNIRCFMTHSGGGVYSSTTNVFFPAISSTWSGKINYSARNFTQNTATVNVAPAFTSSGGAITNYVMQIDSMNPVSTSTPSADFVGVSLGYEHNIQVIMTDAQGQQKTANETGVIFNDYEVMLRAATVNQQTGELTGEFGANVSVRGGKTYKFLPLINGVDQTGSGSQVTSAFAIPPAGGIINYNGKSFDGDFGTTQYALGNHQAIDTATSVLISAKIYIDTDQNSFADMLKHVYTISRRYIIPPRRQTSSIVASRSQNSVRLAPSMLETDKSNGNVGYKWSFYNTTSGTAILLGEVEKIYDSAGELVSQSNSGFVDFALAAGQSATVEAEVFKSRTGVYDSALSRVYVNIGANPAIYYAHDKVITVDDEQGGGGGHTPDVMGPEVQ